MPSSRPPSSSRGRTARHRSAARPARGVLHAPDCTEAPQDAPVLSLDKALDAAEKPGMRLCTLCTAAGELDPLLHGFDHIQDT
ncbi:DUF6233 domain-containing protein [Streptomyces sp. NPDC001205]